MTSQTNETAAMPALQIRHAPGRAWCVAATWPDGHVEDIASFETEVKANEWIANHFDAWLDTRLNGSAAPLRRSSDGRDA